MGRYSNTASVELAEGIFSRWTWVSTKGRAKDPERHLDRVAIWNNVVHFRQAQLLDELHGLEGIDLRLLAIRGWSSAQASHRHETGHGVGRASKKMFYLRPSALLTIGFLFPRDEFIRRPLLFYGSPSKPSTA